MKKFILGTIGVIGLSLVLGACSGEEKESVLSGEKFNISSEEILDGLVLGLGEEQVKRSVVYEVLNKTYKMSDTEIDSAISQLDKFYQNIGGVEGLKQYYGYSDEDLKNSIKRELLLMKAIKEYKNISEDNLKSEYERIKNGKEVITLYVYEEGILSEAEKQLSKANTIEELSEFIKANSEVIEGMQDVYVKDYVDNELNELLNKNTGDIVKVNSVNGYTVISKVLKDKELSYEEALPIFETEFVLKDLTDPELWVYANLYEDKKIKVNEKYKFLESTSVNDLEAEWKLKEGFKNVSEEENNKEESDTELNELPEEPTEESTEESTDNK